MTGFPVSTDWAGKWTEYQPDKVAFKSHETGHSLTYGDLDRLGNRVAHHWREELGLEKGDRVAVLAENCLEYIVLFVAAQKSGCILVPLNYRLAPAEIGYLLDQAEPKVLITESIFAEKTAPHQLPDLAERISLAEFSHFCTPSTHPGDTYTCDVVLTADDPVFILFTSGSTGWPKGVLYTHGMLYWNSANTSMTLVVNGDSRTVTCMPPFHTAGWNVLLTPFFHHGGYTCLMKKFDAETVLDLLESEGATMFMGVPTMLRMMAEAPNFERADLSQLWYILAGGESMPIPLIETWHAKGVAIRQGYGMTEAGPNLTSLHHDDAISEVGSIGRPNFFVQTRIVDPAGQDCGPGEAGELLIKGPMVTPGYWRNPEATAKAIVEGWLHTGDRVKRTPGGYLYVVDRIKNMFISGGENVYPAEIERTLQGHPQVTEVAVIGVADAKWGEVGKAFVVVEGEENGAELRAYCQERLAKYKVPKHYEFMSALPKGATGKIDRQQLK